jgi:hypothetical protein
MKQPQLENRITQFLSRKSREFPEIFVDQM